MPRTPIPCGIAFGSNLGDRLVNLSMARQLLLERLDPAQPAEFSPIYESEPVGCEPGAQPFYNAVAEVSFDGSPHELLELCQGIEVELGRPSRRPKNAPRTADLDLLYAGDLVVVGGQLTLPHPRLAERRFVLAPLAAIRPQLVLPGGRATVAQLLKNLVSDEPPPRKLATSW